MATTEYTIVIDDDYVAPEGQLTAAQYVTFVMNMAALSYANNLSAADKQAGIVAAKDAYNASLPSE